MRSERDEIIPDTFIVTLVNTTGDFDMDVELPAELSVGEMCDKLINVLKSIDGEKFSGWKCCRLRYKNRFLSDTETLSMAGAFDGSRIVVEE